MTYMLASILGIILGAFVGGTIGRILGLLANKYISGISDGGISTTVINIGAIISVATGVFCAAILSWIYLSIPPIRAMMTYGILTGLLSAVVAFCTSIIITSEEFKE